MRNIQYEHKPFLSMVDSALDDPHSREQLLLILRKCYSVELLLFYEDVKAYKKFETDSEFQTSKFACAVGIFTTYCVAGAALEVNISEQQKKTMAHQIAIGAQNELLQTLFDEAQLEVAKLLVTNFLGTFLYM